MTRLLAILLLALPLWLTLSRATESGEYQFFNPDVPLDITQVDIMCPDLYQYDIRCFSLNQPRMLESDREDWAQAYDACLATGWYTPEECIGFVIVDGEF